MIAPAISSRLITLLGQFNTNFSVNYGVEKCLDSFSMAER